MGEIRTISASEFKAKCLDILDRVGDRRFERVAITKRGRVVAVLTAPQDDAASVHRLHGFLRGSVAIPAGFDLTAPVTDEAFGAEDGTLHG